MVPSEGDGMRYALLLATAMALAGCAEGPLAAVGLHPRRPSRPQYPLPPHHRSLLSRRCGISPAPPMRNLCAPVRDVCC
jgi:hypothetical protein